MSVPKRPVLRYHGGKWRIAPWIISHFPRHRVYVEPFGGVASVLLRKPRSYAEVYNDRWSDIVEVFRVLRDPAQAARLASAVTLTPFARDEFEAIDPASYARAADPVERARQLIFRSLAGFGSNAHNLGRKTGFRSNSDRSGTTPAHDWANYPQAIAAFVDRLRGVVIENRSAGEVMLAHDGPDTLHYVDPPYVHSARAMNNPYDLKYGGYAHEMTDAEHCRLSEVLRSLDGMVILSGYPSPLYDELFGDWHQVDTVSHADGARVRTERLWLNPACVAALRNDHGPLFEGVAA
ncbi:MAG: DNA adenine methylase [Burkholderiaceae bacterium]